MALVLGMATRLVCGAPAPPEIAVNLSHGPGGMTITPKGSLILSIHQYNRVLDRVIEVTPKGEIRLFPDDQLGRGKPASPVALDAVQGLECDDEGVVWALDNGRRSETIPKIVGWNTKENRLEKFIYLPAPATRKTSYLHDLAVDPEEPFLYVSDPASGSDAALIVVDRRSGEARRILEGHFTVIPEEQPLVIEGRRFEARRPDGSTVEPQVGVNPIAVDRKGRWLYYGPLKGRTLYRIATEHLQDRTLRPGELASRFEAYAEKPICDSISLDSKGNIYLGDLEANAIGVIDEKTRKYRIHVSDPRFLWPDGLCFGVDGRLYFFASQLHRSAELNRGKDDSEPPFHVFKIKALASGSVGR